MDVICESCNAVYELDAAQIQGASVRVKCSTCGHMFRVYKEQLLQEASKQEKGWQIRFKDGAQAQVPDLATLQKWVVEGKVGRFDELSRDGSSWQALGQVADLVPFFQLVEKLGAPGDEPKSVQIVGDVVTSSGTLEFGGDDDAPSEEATDFALSAAPVQEAALAGGLQQAGQEEVEEATEIGLQGASMESLQEPAPGNGAGEPAAAMASSGEWFMGPGEVPPAEVQADDGLRDFSNYDDLGSTYDDELDDYGASGGGGLRWLLVGVAALFVVFVVFVLVQPKMFAGVSLALGLLDEHPDAREKLEEGRSLLHRFTPGAFQLSEARASKAQKIQGKAFAGQQALQARIALSRASYHWLQLQALEARGERFRSEATAVDQKRKALAAPPKEEDKDKAKKAKKKRRKKKSKKEKEAAAEAAKKKAEELKALDAQFKALSDKYKAATREKAGFVKLYEKHRTVGEGILRGLRARKVHEIARVGFVQLASFADKAAFDKAMAKAKTELKDAQHQDLLTLFQGFQALQSKQYSQSDWSLRKVLQRHGDWVFARLARAWGLVGVKKMEEAQAELQTVLRMEKGHAVALLLLAEAKAQAAVVAKAKPSAPTPARPQAPQTPQTRQPPQARPGARPVATKAPTRRVARGPATFRGLFRRAERYRRRESYRSALRYYRRALKKKKTSRVYSGIGWCLLETRGASRAVKSFLRAMKLSKRNPDAYYGLALAYRRMRKKSKAKAMLKEFLRRFPRRPEAGEVRAILRNL